MSSRIGTRSGPPKADEISHSELGEKEEKLKDRESKRIMKVFLFLGALSLIFVVAIVKMRHSKYTPRSLRVQENIHSKTEKGSHRETTFLPPNSIYRLKVKDYHGALTSLEKYAGMVSLVVNVASE